MPIYAKHANDLDEVDVIIAGGGTAGCIVASRLAEADPSLSILVIEAGANSKNVPSIRHPAFFPSHISPESKTAIFYKGNKSDALAGREPIVPTGGTLGGGSSINFMMYARGQQSDFDEWGVEGWSGQDVLPFMKKLETYHGPSPDKSKHGYEGPVNITGDVYRAVAPTEQYIEAAGRLGIPEIVDLHDLKMSHGVQRCQRYVGPDGTRQDASHRYLHPKVDSGDYSNLHVLVETKVIRVIFDDEKRAVGVECTPNSAFQPVLGNLTGHPVTTIKARRLVIASAGAIATPLLLERSGVGDADVLRRAGVEVVEEVKGVGTEYQDHHLVLYPYRTNLAPEDTLDGFLSGRLDSSALLKSNDKLLSWNGVEISSKMRMSDEDVDSLGQEFRDAWDQHFRDIPSKPVMLTAVISCFLGDPTLVPAGQYITVGNYTAYPFSRGHVHIKGPNVDDPIDFETGFLSDANDIDLKKQVWAYKKQRELMRRTRMFRGEVEIGHPVFPEGSAAALTTIPDEAPENNPDEISDIAYTAEDDKAIEAFVRANLNTTWHSIGTCRCAPREQGGVVDKDLNVYGVKGLKIADLSVPPINVAANTNNTALMIGEKAADIIIRELGLRSVGEKEQVSGPMRLLGLS